MDKMKKWFAEDSDRQVAFEWAAKNREGNEFRTNFFEKVMRYGDTTDKFVAAILKDKARTEEWEARRAEERANMVPVVVGNGIIIQGKVVSVKTKFNDYGERLVMTVKDDRGFLVWGSVPAAIDDVQKGDIITFTANVEASDGDETFGFFKRPRQAMMIVGVSS